MDEQLNRVKLRLPAWLPALYIMVAVGLVPWIFVLSATLPARHVSRHWDLAWVGFDVGMLAVVVLTAILAYRRSWWVCLSSMAVFTMLVVDAWFDVLTSRPGEQTAAAIALAVLVELPLAAMSLWLAHKVASELVRAK